MCILIPIRYMKHKYPPNITPKIEEISARFNIKETISPEMDYSLHTEYSYGESKLNSPFLAGLKTIKRAHNTEDHIPKLWSKKAWAKEFAIFIKRVVGDNKPPTIIEIHPPFKDYCGSIEEFIDIYKVFEDEILMSFPDVKIVIENRCGTRYKGNFLISTPEDILELYRLLKNLKLRLRIALDFPQIFTSEKLGPGNFSREKIVSIIRKIYPCSSYITEFHIWGKKCDKHGKPTVHHGDLNTYFEDKKLKRLFLKEVFHLFHEGMPRYFLPEVNTRGSNGEKETASIVNDFRLEGFKFENM